MTSLREIKRRISSIRSIWKITSAMRMIASAKLHRAQGAVANMLLYEQRLYSMLSALISDEEVETPYTQHREVVKRVAIVAFSSNSSLCGAFNMNVVRKLNSLIRESYATLSPQDILLFPVGRKVYETVIREGYTPQGDFRKMMEKPSCVESALLARRLMELFVTHQVDRVELVYNHYKNMAVQLPTIKQYLPLSFVEQNGKREGTMADYILEPSQEEILTSLLPKVLELQIFATLLDSVAAEHAARTVAMQLATDNAGELLDELTLLYNKSRQQAITNELLDIAGGLAR